MSGTKCLWLPQFVNKFLGWLNKFGPAQNIWGPVKGQGICLQSCAYYLTLLSKILKLGYFCLYWFWILNITQHIRDHNHATFWIRLRSNAWLHPIMRWNCTFIPLRKVQVHYMVMVMVYFIVVTQQVWWEQSITTELEEIYNL